MKHSFIDTYADLPTPVHRLKPVYKLVILIFFLLFIVMTPVQKWFLIAVYAAVLIWLFLLSRVPFRFFLKRLLHLIPFILIISFSAMFSSRGMVLFVSCLTKGILAVIAALIVSTTTKFTDIINALKELHIPFIFINLLSFFYRYTFLLEDQLLLSMRAVNSRSAASSKALRDFRTIGNIVGSLFVRTYERAERVYFAMCARGYDYGKDNRNR